MLIANYSYINQICGHNHSGITNPIWCVSPHTFRGYFGRSQYESIQEQIKRDSIPTGTNTPYSLVMGDSGGLLSSTTLLLGDGELTSALSKGINIGSSLSGTGTISTSSLSLIISLGSSLAGSGNLTNASLVGTIALAGALTGVGNVTAGLNVIAFMSTSLTGSATLSANLKGLLGLDADIYVNQSEFTVNQIVEGVWNAVAASYNTSGTMGAAMNAAGLAGDPWTATLPGSYASGSAGDILGNILANIPDSVWNELKTSHTTDESYGKIVQDLERLSKQIKALTAANL